MTLQIGCKTITVESLFDGTLSIPANAQNLVRILGVEPERVRLEWISAAEAPKFTRVIKELVEDVKRIGRSPYGFDS